MALDSASLIRTTQRPPGELSRMREFVEAMEPAAQNTDVTAAGLGSLTIVVSGSGRWMAAQFRFGNGEYFFAGPVLSADLLVPTMSSIQFQPRLALTKGIGDELVPMDEATARPPWNALKRALALVAERAAADVGLDIGSA